MQHRSHRSISTKATLVMMIMLTAQQNMTPRTRPSCRASRLRRGPLWLLHHQQALKVFEEMIGDEPVEEGFVAIEEAAMELLQVEEAGVRNSLRIAQILIEQRQL